MIRLFTFLLLAVLSFPGWGAIIYSQDWEMNQVTNTKVGNLYEKAPGAASGTPCFTRSQYGYDSFQTSTRFAKSGTRSLRNENHTARKHTEAECDVVDRADGLDKARQSIVYGTNTQQFGFWTPTDQTKGILLGHERWYGLSYYYPSDEGTFNSWWSTTTDTTRHSIFQILDFGHSATPSVFIIIGKQGKIDVQSAYSTNPTTEVKQWNPSSGGYFVKDAWNNLVVHHKRACDNTGILEVWINGVKVTSHINTPVAICDKPTAYMDAGQYWGTSLANEIRVQYVDNIKMGDENSSYAEVDPSGSAPPPPPPTFIDTVNGGAAVNSNQYPVNFTMSPGTTDGILSCSIGPFSTEAERMVRYNESIKTGYFRAPDLTGLSTVQNLNCLRESQLTKYPGNTSWGQSGTAEADWVGDLFGYTTGLTITKTAVSNISATKGDGVDLYATVPEWTTTAGFNIEFDIIFPTTQDLGKTYEQVFDSYDGSPRTTMYLQDSGNTIRIVGATTTFLDGQVITDGAALWPTDGAVHHVKMVGTGVANVLNILKRWDVGNYGTSTVFNLLLEDIATPANSSFYAMNETIASSVIVDTGVRSRNGAWINRLAGDVITLPGGGTGEYAYATKFPGPGSDLSGVTNDKIAVDFIYACDAAVVDVGSGKNSCQNLYFAVEDHASGNHAITMQGTAGVLSETLQNGGFGTNVTTKNWTVDAANQVYRNRILFKVGAEGYDNYYNLYAGTRNGFVGQAFQLLDVIPHKNYTTTTLSKEITIGTTDTTPPTVDPCTITNVPDPQPDVTPTTYKATVSCTTTEVGGEYFVMLRDTNAAPANADAVIAGTGAFRSATGPVSETTITAEFPGLTYQDLWVYVVHKDAADNVSAVASVSFDDGVGSGQEKKIKFSDDKLKRGANYLTCTGSCSIDHFKVYARNPLVYTGEPVLAHWQSVQPSVGTMELTESSIFDGSVNNLNPGVNYWWFLFDEDKDPLFFGEKTITVE